MSNLDDKLKEILFNKAQGLEELTYSTLESFSQDEYVLNTIALIKQAFADERWINPMAKVNSDKYVIKMTGQEWYDRLITEFLKVNKIYETPEQDDWLAKFSDVVHAAKKASGLE